LKFILLEIKLDKKKNTRHQVISLFIFLVNQMYFLRANVKFIPFRDLFKGSTLSINVCHFFLCKHGIIRAQLRKLVPRAL